MSTHRWIILVLLLASFCYGGKTAVAQSSDPVVLRMDQEQYPLGLHIEILEDKGGLLTIEDVTSPEIAADFVPSQEEAPGFGFTESAYWVRFQFRNESQATVNWLLLFESEAFFIDYYLQTNDAQGYEVIQTGSALPFDSRAVPTSWFAFPLPVSLHQTHTIHVRFESDGSLILPLSVWNAESYFQRTLLQRVLDGFLYGILFILVVYNLVLFFYVKDISYLFYGLFFSTTLLAMMAMFDFGDQYLWPSRGSFIAIAPRLFLVFSFTFALLFATIFLQTKENAPHLHIAMIALAVANTIALSLQFIWFRATAAINLYLMIIGCIVMITAGYSSWRNGYRPALYFLMGWLLVALGFLIFFLTLVDLLPMTVATFGMLRVGLVILAIILSIGLAERINVYRRQKDLAEFAVVAQRGRIAQDLHDSVTQSLYSANLIAEAGRRIVELGDRQSASHYFYRIGATTQQALKEMRLFLYELRPPDVVEDGLVEALQRRLDTVENWSGIEARLIVDGEVDYPVEVGDQLFRISQEALNNVVKHAEADKVAVYLHTNGLAALKVVDNGRGFDLAKAERAGGFGLKSMQDRVTQIGGNFIIETAPGQGTTIQVEIRQTDE